MAPWRCVQKSRKKRYTFQSSCLLQYVQIHPHLEALFHAVLRGEARERDLIFTNLWSSNLSRAIGGEYPKSTNTHILASNFNSKRIGSPWREWIITCTGICYPSSHGGWPKAYSIVYMPYSQVPLSYLLPVQNRVRCLLRASLQPKGHFTLKTDSPWPLHFKQSHWWKRRSRFKFASHYEWGTNSVRECKMDLKSTWILRWHRMDHVSWSLNLFPKTISWR